jgi:folate-binding protein YgfZ
VYGLVGDVSVPLHFGDPAREIEAIRGGSAALDLAWRGLIEVTGRDRVRFLHGMCTNDVKELQPGKGCMAALVSRQGKMIAEIVVRAHPERLTIEADRSSLQPIIDALAKFIVADDVKFAISPMAAVGRWGPGPEHLKGLGPFDFVEPEGRIVSRELTLGVEGFVGWTPPGATVELNAPFAGFQAYEALRIENGFPRWGADLGPDLLPMEAGLEAIAISYTKGCYIGQEVIQRVKTYSEPPRMLVQLDVAGAAPGEKVSAGGQEIGQVTSASAGLALGIVRKEYRAPGTKVEVGGRPAGVRALPWQSKWPTSA